MFKIFITAVRFHIFKHAASRVSLMHFRHGQLYFLDLVPFNLSEELMVLDFVNIESFLAIWDYQSSDKLLCSVRQLSWLSTSGADSFALICDVMAVRDLRVGQVELSHCYLLTMPILRFFVWESEIAVFNPLFLLLIRTLHRKGHLSSHHLVSK